MGQTLFCAPATERRLFSVTTDAFRLQMVNAGSDRLLQRSDLVPLT